jgi:hypothetical protein
MMKRITAILLMMIMVLGTVACGNTEESKPETVAGVLLEDFKADTEGTAQEIAERIASNDIIPFEAVALAVEPGYLAGFDNAEITGFESGVMFAPMMSTVPFVGYVFELADDADVDAFKQTLEDNANLRWNICTEAEEMVVDSEGNKVFFIMAPKNFEEAE